MAEPTTDHRRATAERNLAAILDATERLLERGAALNVAAVAAAAGVSRVTFYAHFAGLDALLEAVVQRAVGHAAQAFERADLESGPPEEALDRLLAAGWERLERHDAVARAAALHLSSDAMARSHVAAREPIRRLIERGRREGAFRTDVPTDFLVTVAQAVIHATGDEVRAGRLDRAAAAAALASTLQASLAP
jgi:TetR/AcrR family transcriptional repressor of mexCD-oprJ operon